jgi:hypothetical protein
MLLPWLTFLAIIATFAVNVWSNLSPINGETIGEISNTLFADVQIIPANYAFAIWGVIYIGIIGFGIYQLLPAQRQNLRLNRIRPWLILACVAQAIWVFFFLERQFWLSVVAMLAILLPLILIYRQLEVGRQPAGRAEKWLVQLPFGIYLGWISVATIVNIASALYSQNWNGLGISPTLWTVIMMVAATVVAAILTLQHREIAFPLVIIWALVAVAVRQTNIPLIVMTAIALSFGLAVLVFLKVVGKPKVT